MPIRARFGRVNLVASDWRHLAAFYADLFGWEPVPPERDYWGPELEAGTRVPGVTWSYVTDPEGNIIKLQSWSEA